MRKYLAASTNQYNIYAWENPETGESETTEIIIESKTDARTYREDCEYPSELLIAIINDESYCEEITNGMLKETVEENI